MAGAVQLDGARRPRFYMSASGLWVGKRLPKKSRRAELIGSLLGRELGVPVPPVGLCETRPEFVFSAWQDTPSHWARSKADLADNYESLGAALALDALIGNDDRNPRNILLQALERPGKSHMYTLHFIDHEGSLAGDLARLRGLEHEAEPGSLPPDYPTDVAVLGSAMEAAQCATEISETRVSALVAASCGGDPAAIQNKFVEALAERLDDASGIVETYFQKVHAR